MAEAASSGKRFTLAKADRLKSRLAFAYLFEHGSSMRVGVLNVFYAYDPPPALCPRPLLAAFSAPKRRFKRAVDRNRLKRLMREAYRLHQPILREPLDSHEQRLIVLFSYQHRTMNDYDRIRRSMVKALHLLAEARPAEGGATR
jgi:ribonuclease P protein component